MSAALITLAVVLVFLVGFFTGAVVVGALICDRIHLAGRFDAGPVVIVGKLEHKHGNWK